MEIRRATEEDFELVYDLWKKEVKNLGVPYKEIVRRTITKRDFYLMFDNDNFIGMGGYYYSKKYGDYSIIALAVVEEYRRCGYASKLLLYLIRQIVKTSNKLFGEPVIFISAIDGAINNYLYSKYCDEVGYEEYKTCTTIIYKVNLEKCVE